MNAARNLKSNHIKSARTQKVEYVAQLPQASRRGELLSSRKLQQISRQDSDCPSLWKFLAMEAFEWLFLGALLFILWTFVRMLLESMFPG